ncbi:MAG: VaFE repeat-containing surface-anchored protein, partial [Lachnospiraceae bacterium]|nr:VaFE repeat-containing surface-anchored protein [Lachnospiraceae bacterium]
MKKNILRRVLAMTLALIMGLSVASPFDLTAFAADASEESATYTVEIQDSQNGTVRFKDSSKTSREYSPGDTVTLTAEPDDGYELDELTATSSEKVTLNEKSETTFTFEMPESDVTVKATFSTVVEAVTETEAETTEASTEAETTEAGSEEETTEAAETTEETEAVEETEAAETEITEEETTGEAAEETEEAEETKDTAETEETAAEAVTILGVAAATEEETAEEESSLTEAAQAVQDMIDALPSVDDLEGMDTDELNEAYDAILAADEAWQALSGEEQESVDDSKLDELYEYFNTLTTTTALTGTSKYVSVSKTAKYRYSSYSVGSSWSTNKYEVEYTVDGTKVTAYAYCVEPSESAPGSGKYTVTKLSSNNTLAKVIYYGTESLSGSNCFWEQEGYSSYSTGYRWIIVHIATAYAYGRSDWDYCITSSTAKSLAKKLVSFAEDADALPSGSSIEEPYFSYVDDDGDTQTNEDGSKLVISAVASTSQGDQYTPDITFNADETVYVKVKLQEGMSYVVLDNPSGNGSSTVRDSDGTDTVTIYGGTTFRFRAPIDQAEEVSSTFSKTLTVKNLKDFSAYKLQYGKSGYQSLVTVFGDSLEATTAFKINWVSNPSLSITKSVSSASDVYAQMMVNNPNYSLEGAQYGVYATKADAQSDTNRLRTFNTYEGGQSKTMTMISPTYSGDETYYTAGQKLAVGDVLYIKEITAPSGYQLDTTVYKVTLTSGDNELEVEDVPIYATVSVQKADKAYLEGEISADDIADLSNILFRLQYKKISSFDDVSSVTNTRAWGIMTDESGVATFDAEHITSIGSSPYELDDGTYAIPLGYLNVRECDETYTYLENTWDEEDDGALNTAYTPSGMTWTVGDKTYSGTRNVGLMLQEKVLDDGTKTVEVVAEDGTVVSTGSSLQLTAEDYQSAGDLTIEKVSAYNKQKLAGATFHLEDSDGNTVVPTNDNGITGDIDSDGTITVQSDGAATVEHIPAGTYTLVEDNAPVGYKVGEVSKNLTILSGTQTETVENSPALAGIKIQKYDTDTGEAEAEGDAILEGATFDIITLQDIYNDKSGTEYSAGDVVYTLTTDENGCAETPADILTVGSYKIVETNAPDGYDVGDAITFTISQADDGTLEATLDGSTTTLTSEETDDGTVFSLTDGEISDTVLRGGVSIQKRDAQSEDGTAQGAATLAGAVINIYNISENAILADTDGDGEMETYESGQLAYTLTTGTDGSAQTASDLLPYGTYVAVEVSSPTGYLSMQKSYLSDSEAAALGFTYSSSQDIYYDEASETSYFYDTKEQAFYCYTAYTTQSTNRLHVSSYGSYESKFEIREAGETVDLTGEEGSIYDLVKRGDFSIYKVDDETQQPMEGVQFKITSVTTGESHIVTTDANGYYSSAQTAHSSEDGLWFGLDANGNSVSVDDSLGALPYDTYYIEELESEANEGMIMWSGYIYVTADTVYENGYVINLDINNRRPIISTSASNEETGNKYLAASEGAVVEDAITYKNLEAGTYLLRSVLMDRDTKKVIVDAQGKEAISETTVKLTSSEGSTTAEITLDASSLSGVNAVVFEYFYTVAEDGTETLVYSHTDFEDQEQYVYFAGIGTTATDSDTEDHVACADEEITLVDVVEYTNLPANRIFTVTGTLMLKSTGEEYLDDNGNTVTAEATFTSSETGNGSVEVTFTFSGANLAGDAVVVFEEVERSGITYAVHADINDEGQTVYFPEIGTKAEDAKTGLSEGLVEGTVSIKDTVSYSGLTVGKTYTVTGTLMDQSTGEALTDSEGNAYTASTEFTAEEKDGSTVVTFTVPGSVLLGKSVVVFENLYYEGKQIAIHADIKDKDQTVDYPKIGTTATDAETGLHGNYADEDTELTIIDTVEYTNLTPNTLHTMTGTLMDKSTG